MRPTEATLARSGDQIKREAQIYTVLKSAFVNVVFPAPRSDGTALFQLAGCIVEVFDRYQVYRPELLLRWEAGEDADKWQARLWRRLCAGQTPHRAWLYADCRRRLMAPPPILPERLHLFGMSSLAPVYWQLFQQLGRHMAVHCFQLSPCRDF